MIDFKLFIMKKILFFTFIIAFTLPCFAQRDIKTFNKIGIEGIIRILGNPSGTEGFEDSIDILEYPEETRFCVDENTRELVGFNTISPEFCILSDYVKGGFKVGDKFSKVQAFDFVHSKYGKNRKENALKLIDSNERRDYYVIYAKEKIHFFLSVKDGVIIGIDMGTPEEDTGYDKTNKLW